MSEAQNLAIAHQWFAAFNAHNLAGLLALYAEDAEHFSPKLLARQPESLGSVRGKAALGAWWGDAFARLASLRYEVLKLTADDERVFMEYLRHVEGEPELRVGEVLEIRDDRIVASRVYHG
ncbi:MAG: nuclear transport factor 2 family protein [Planctomycetes bacterium]|nr:nuclear transport factor 2 family protein [Planctomycetota bacterium]MCB9910164.1 nuclear transport factor 2 family protein [Planctomycetota bacterium]HPF15315.1 nuclear transport factor 2 family protein [Planctomycetota bacterium]HRV81112.1 nuclear transport factor 2 family protein [Planctomycetota bacterium]